MRLNCANVNFTAAFGTADVFSFSINWLHMPPPYHPCPVSSFEAHFCDSSVAIHGVKSSICHKTSLTLHDMQEVVCLRKEKSMSLIPYIELQKLMHWHLLIRHLEYAYMDHYRWPHAILTETFLRRWHFWHEWSFFSSRHWQTTTRKWRGQCGWLIEINRKG